MKQPLVSIIVPVYNAGKTLGRMLNSIKQQSYKNLQIIFVNDCSSDDSLSKLVAFETECSDLFDIEIITYEKNKGVATARNTGLDNSQGEYIYFVDADDYIEPNTISDMVGEARLHSADIVGCNWYLSFDKNEREMSQRSFATPLEALQNIMRGVMRWNLWLFMVRRDLYEQNKFRFIPEQNMGEDLYIMVQLFLLAQKVVHINKYLYHYWEGNPASLTNNYSERYMGEVDANVKRTEQAVLASEYRENLLLDINYMKLNIKLPLLISSDTEKYKRWQSWFVEANDYIFKNPSLSMRIKIIQYCALKKQYWILKLYYYLVVKFVYGVIYK